MAASAVVALLTGAGITYYVYKTITRLLTNLAAAKRTGLPYYIMPFSPYNPFAQMTWSIWSALYKLAPRSWWKDIIITADPQWHYRLNHRAFEKLGETFVVVSPYKMLMYTNSAEVIHQVTSRREAFQKPLADYELIKQYGLNVVTTEGAEWRMHRKITSSSFNEKNTAFVFDEAIAQTQGMLEMWREKTLNGDKTIKTLEDDTMAVALHIIAFVGFGMRLLWPGQKMPADVDKRMVKYATLEVPEGHTMSFLDALHWSLHYILPLLLVPKWILKIWPDKRAKLAVESQREYLQYMGEFLQDKIDEVRMGIKSPGMDFMGSLVSSSYGEKGPKAPGKGLSDQEILGNAWIMLFAGHETTGNTVHFSLLFLAMNPSSQRRLQKDVDRIVGTKDPKTWDYEENVNAMTGSMLGATVNEVLRLMTPVPDIPKLVSENEDQTIVIDGQKHVLAGGMGVSMTAAALHRNPKYWPSKPQSKADPTATNDLDDFVPERWFVTDAPGGDETVAVEGADDEDYGGFQGRDTSEALYRPPRGAFIPFSDGARSCLGRRIAMVELIAVLAVVFQTYTIELAVDEWATDEEVAKMTREEKAAVYAKATQKARDVIKTCTALVTLKLHGKEFVPIRLVPRGEERFVDWIDE